MEDDIEGRTPILKSILILNGSQPQWKSDRKQMALVCLASQFCTELGPAQPQLVLFVYYESLLHLTSECISSNTLGISTDLERSIAEEGFILFLGKVIFRFLHFKKRMTIHFFPFIYGQKK